MSFDFDNLFLNESIDNMVHTLNNILFEGFRRFVPFYVREKRDIKCPWNNAALRKLKNKKNKEWKKFKSTGNKLLYEKAFLNYFITIISVE